MPRLQNRNRAEQQITNNQTANASWWPTWKEFLLGMGVLLLALSGALFLQTLFSSSRDRKKPQDLLGENALTPVSTEGEVVVPSASSSSSLYLKRDVTPVSSEVQITNGTGVNYYQNPSVATLSDGNRMWAFECPDGSSTGICLQVRSPDDSTAVTGIIQTNAFTAGDQITPQVRALNAGGAVLAYVSTNQASGSSAADIILKFVNNNATTAVSEFVATPVTASNQYGPSLAVYPNDKVVLVYTDYNPSPTGGLDPSYYAVGQNCFYPNGTSVGSLVVNTYTTSYQAYGAVEILNDDEHGVVWHSYNQDASSTYGIYFQRISKDCVTKLGSETPIDTTAGDQIAPNIAVLNNRYGIAYTSSISGSPLTYFQEVTNASALFGSRVLVSSTTGGDQAPRIMALPNANPPQFGIAWTSNGGSGSIWHVFFRSIVNGATSGVQRQVDISSPPVVTVPAYSVVPFMTDLVSSSSNQVLVPWTSTGPGGTGNKNIYTTKFQVVSPPGAAPVASPVAAPVLPPVAAPAMPPVAAPTLPPVTPPVAAPIQQPIASPVVAPTASPVASPVTSPIAAPVQQPVASPVEPPQSAPIAQQPVSSPFFAPAAPKVPASAPSTNTPVPVTSAPIGSPDPSSVGGDAPTSGVSAAAIGGGVGGGVGALAIVAIAAVLFFRRKSGDDKEDGRLNYFLGLLQQTCPVKASAWIKQLYMELNLDHHLLEANIESFKDSFKAFVVSLAERLMAEATVSEDGGSKKSKRRKKDQEPVMAEKPSATASPLSGLPLLESALTDASVTPWLVSKIKENLLKFPNIYKEENGVGKLTYGEGLEQKVSVIASAVRKEFPNRQVGASDTHIEMPSVPRSNGR